MWELAGQAQELRLARRPFALATVVRRERPASAHPGDQAIITADGTLHGWIGGSCAEPVVVAEARRAIREGSACLVRLGPPDARMEVTAEGIRVYPMTCHSGGTLEIFVDPCLPAPRALLVGHGPVVEALADLAGPAGFEVVLCSPAADPSRFPRAARIVQSLDALGAEPDPFSYVVVATHGQADEEPLAAALRGDAPYVALVASARRAAVCKETLLAMGVEASRIERLCAPAGLDLGAVTPGEIAVSILAEMIQRRRSAAVTEHDDPAYAPPPASAVDPVCGMTVDPVAGTPSSQFEGTTYYFCCPSCRQRFQRSPQAFLPAMTTDPH